MTEAAKRTEVRVSRIWAGGAGGALAVEKVRDGEWRAHLIDELEDGEKIRWTKTFRRKRDALAYLEKLPMPPEHSDRWDFSDDGSPRFRIESIRLGGLPKLPEPPPIEQLSVQVELHRKRRGHDFYVVPSECPGLGSDDWDLDTVRPMDPGDAIVWAHFFGPGDWWVTEYDPATGRAWGFVDLGIGPGCAEWGPFWLPELESIHPNALTIIERDCFWTPVAAREVHGIVAAGGAS